jgi:hypothetical protein
LSSTRRHEESPRHPLHSLCGHEIWCSWRPRHGFLTKMPWQTTASKGMHVVKLLASWRRKVSLAVHVAHADNVLRGLSAAVDGAEAASSSTGMPSPTTALLTRAMAHGPQASPCFLPRARRRLSHSCGFQRHVGVSCVLLCFIC